MTQKGLPLIFSAPSGTGKTTLREKLKQELPDIEFSVSHTTRPPRANEKDGVDYYFISKEAFLNMIDCDEFLEWAQIHDHYYGTSRTTTEKILEMGKDLILELDVQGVESLRALKYQGVYIFILPPSMQELEKRLTGRGTESGEQVKKRLRVGEQEISKSHLYDYRVTNTNIDETVDTILAIIRAEKNRVDRYHTDCPEIRKLIESEPS
ncbi:MAG: guanylate kinase [Nitrospinota bacterium]|nr:guanylate kinase [Nitrospinota bacterium]